AAKLVRDVPVATTIRPLSAGPIPSEVGGRLATYATPTTDRIRARTRSKTAIGRRFAPRPVATESMGSHLSGLDHHRRWRVATVATSASDRRGGTRWSASRTRA